MSRDSERPVTYVRVGACIWRTAAVYPPMIRDARLWARGQLADRHVPDETVDDAVLIVSELLTSVLREAPGEAELTLLVEAQLLTITCADRDRAAIRSGTLDRNSPLGRSLALVDLLSLGCFVRRRTGGGKRLVALIPIAASQS